MEGGGCRYYAWNKARGIGADARDLSCYRYTENKTTIQAQVNNFRDSKFTKLNELNVAFDYFPIETQMKQV